MPHSHHLDDITTVIFSNIKTSLDLKINTDSRSFSSGETFVALVGENFDGFNYIEDVLKLQPACVVFEEKEERREKVLAWQTVYPEVYFVSVTDTLKFLQELASLHIKEWREFKSNRKVIGITGSNGKTTHKEMLKHILSKILDDRVLATKGNLNNHIGVPLTIFNLNNEHDAAIIEMGMNHQGEIEDLCNIVNPEHGLITNVGPAHIEFMKSVENIFVEKSALYKAVLINSSGEGMFVINADDEHLNLLEKSNGLTRFGEVNGDVKVKINIPNISFNFNSKDYSFRNVNIQEKYNLKNLVGVTLLAMKLYPDKIDEILSAAESYTQPNMNRSIWAENIFLDAYNANPASMKTSLNSFFETIKNKNISLDDCYFVLGDMNELGDFSEKFHGEIGKYLQDNGVKNVCFIGRFRDFYLKTYTSFAHSFLTKDEFKEQWMIARKKYKYIFIKASRSLQLETLLNIK